MANWLSLLPQTKETPLAAALRRPPWAQQGAVSRPGPFPQAAAGTISLRPAPMPPYDVHADSSPVKSSSAAASGSEQAGIARGTSGQLESVVPGGHAHQLLTPMAWAPSIGVSAPTREPPAMQWARAHFQEPPWLAAQPRETWQGAELQQDVQAQTQGTWGAVLRNRRPAQGLGRPSIGAWPGSTAPRAEVWPQTYEPADGGRQRVWPQTYEPADGGRQRGAEARGGPAAAAVPGRHVSGSARGVAAMLAAMADAKERQADDIRILAYFATAAASTASQQEEEHASGRMFSLAPAAAARPQSNQPEVGVDPRETALHSSAVGNELAAMLAAVAAAKERQGDERHLLGCSAANGGYCGQPTSCRARTPPDINPS